MIGNDIIDLHYTSQHSNWQRRGFLDKIFTKEEQVLITRSSNKFQKVWLLWSMKESAYKAHFQKHHKRFFNPKMIQCKLFSKNTGQVSILEERFITQTDADKDVIHTIAFSVEEPKNPTAEYFAVEKSSYPIQQSETRRKLMLTAEKLLNIPSESMRIIKNKAGVPQLFSDGNLVPISFSLTHHGRFGAYCISES